MNAVNEKISTIMEKRLHLIETPTDERNLLSSPEFAELLNKCKTDWKGIAENFEDVEGALSPYGRMRAFVVDNYAHARVANLLNRIKAKAVNADFKNSLDSIINGEDKTALDDYREGYQGLPEGDIPRVFLAE